MTDCLSRNLVKDAKPVKDEFTETVDLAIQQLTATLPIKDSKLAEIRTSTADYQNKQVLKLVILSGWPDRRKDCPDTIMDHWNHRD